MHWDRYNRIAGEVSEWFKVQHSKCCEQQCSEGSNPSFSVRGSGEGSAAFSFTGRLYFFITFQKRGMV